VPEMPVKAPMNLREMCAKYSIRFKKALGQNLLLDDNINRIMVEAAALSKDDDVVEVGAGLGALTRRLAADANRVLSVEIDASFMPCLQEQFGDLEHVRLFRGDILNHSLRDLVEEYLPNGSSYKMISNLPYYITTPVLFHFLESPVHFSRLVVMVQSEVGDRLVAPVNTADYGVLTLAAQCRAEVDLVHRVPATCFIPRPKVDSCIVSFRLHPNPPDDAVFLMKLVKAAFMQRRKTLQNSLIKSGNFGAPKEAVTAAFAASGIDPGRRPQTLDMADFKRLAQEIRSRL
jgi:16S rRNA (adenine1518-N6/adenine1519-N6)-dimethyltransferase